MKSMRVAQADLANPGDVEAVVDLIDEYARDPMGSGEGLSDDVKTRLIRDLPSQSSVVAFIAYVDETPAGVAMCVWGYSTFAAKPVLNIHDLAVRAEFRKRGTGTALINAIAEFARDRGCCKLTLEVHAQNETALRLYRRTGFLGDCYGIHAGPVYFMHRTL